MVSWQSLMSLHLKLLDIEHPLTFEESKLRQIEAHALIYLRSFSDYEKSLTSVLKHSGVTRVTREWRSREKQGAWEPSVTRVAIFFSLGFSSWD